MASSSPVNPAPGALELVRSFVNTLDIEAGTDRLRDPGGWEGWAREHDLDGSVGVDELNAARGLRESLRTALHANHDRAPLPEEASDALTAAAARAQVVVRFSSGGAELVPTGRGVQDLYGRLVSTIAAAMSDGTWTRLKACAADDCQWGFYDTSRSRTGQWCSMSICGNRTKQARWRRSIA